MARGPGFHGSLINVDLRSDPNIDHLNIDKSPRLHARVIGEVLAIVGCTAWTRPTAAVKPVPAEPEDRCGRRGGQAGERTRRQPAAAKTDEKTSDGVATAPAKPVAETGTPVIALRKKAPNRQARTRRR